MRFLDVFAVLLDLGFAVIIYLIGFGGVIAAVIAAMTAAPGFLLAVAWPAAVFVSALGALSPFS